MKEYAGALKSSRERCVAEWLVVGAIAVAFCYFAETVVLTIVLSILLTYLLDPLVSGCERWRVPRPIGALLSVFGLLGILVGALFLLASRIGQISSDWSGFYTMLQHAASVVQHGVEGFLQRWAHVEPGRTARSLTVLLGGESGIRDLVVRQIDSLSSALDVVAFVPFLVFFMLSEKERLWRTGLKLFSEPHRKQASAALEELTGVLRGYLVGNLLVVAILVLASFLFFLLLGIHYPFLTAIFSGLANIVPYLGALLAWLPPFAIELGQSASFGVFIGIALGLSTFHLLAINALVPLFVGRRIRVNATALTISLLFWSWLWGAMGLLLGIPIVAAIKVVCDHVESWRPVGEWLGTDD